MQEQYKELDERDRQMRHHASTLKMGNRRRRPKVPDGSLEDFVLSNCDWSLFAGNGVTAKVLKDRFVDDGGYVVQTKRSREDGKPKTTHFDNYIQAMGYVREYIETGGK